MENIEHAKLISKGAESHIFEGVWFDFPVIIKKRIPKKYRIDILDKKIREHRTKIEARIIHFARKIGIRTPIIYDVDLKKSTIIMEKINGMLLKDFLEDDTKPLELKIQIMKELGKIVGNMHKNKICHGDLTTSNVIVSKDMKLVIIDFGLSSITDSIEEQGMDLRVIHTALTSTHFRNFELFWSSFIEGYNQTFEKAKKVLYRLHEIELRGRYVEKRRARK
ncbi:MAG: KEOPS complex kinase/ATPase Bud32 [Candidatus Njordarchaeia archaeon]|nr:Kae1-associated serine/threonine protein kinase [Candidatus Korarchaeota archaeon]